MTKKKKKTTKVEKPEVEEKKESVQETDKEPEERKTEEAKKEEPEIKTKIVKPSMINLEQFIEEFKETRGKNNARGDRGGRAS